MVRADGAELSEAARLVPSEERQPRGIRPLVLGLQMLAVKRATKRNAAGAPAVAIIAGTNIVPAV